jgi:hypothetical protein
MDSYGIHATQLAADTAAQHVAAVNQAIQSHNKNVYNEFQKKISSDTTTTKEDRWEGEGLAIKAAVTAGTSIKTAVAMRNKYGGIGRALTQGTSENVYNLTAGFIGEGPKTPVTTLKAGPQELAVRAQAEAAGVGPEGAFRDIRSAQLKDVYARDIKPSELSDPKQGLTRGGVMAAPEIDESELGITGKVISKGLTTAGTDVGTAARIGAVGEGIVGLGAAGYTLYGDIEGGWKKEGGVTKAGDVLSIAGGVLGTAAAAVPILAPVAALTSLAGSVVDAIGEHEDNVNKQANDLAQGPQGLEKFQTAESNVGQLAQQAKASSLQKLSAGGGSF